jgi:hypothetical protein
MDEHARKELLADDSDHVEPFLSVDLADGGND